MDSGSEIDFNDIPEYDSDVSDTEEAVKAGQSRGSSPSRSSSPSQAEEVGHRSSASVSQAEEKSSSTESSGPKVEVDDSSDSEIEAKEDLEQDEEVKPESRKVSAVSPIEETEEHSQRSASPEPSPSPRDASPAPRDASPVAREASPAPKEASPSPRAESPVPQREESPAPREESPVPREESPAPRDASVSPTPTARVESPERKSSSSSSSYDDRVDRANSMSPEPTEPISAPTFASANKDAAPSSQKDITRIYTDKLVNEKPVESFADKVVRSKPAGGDITQIYTASIQAQKEQQSPRLERARGGKPVSDITKLYTANLSKPEPTTPEMASPNRPRRNENITKLYTNGFEQAKAANFKAKPSDEITNPRKHNMATTVNKEGIRDAYNQVMDDHTEINWAVFKFDESNCLNVAGTGEDVTEFKSQFGPDEKGFGYIKIQTGDEMSKRSRFVLVTWVGANISVMKKAKMSTDKLLVKEIIQNLSVEIQTENNGELSYEHLKTEVDKAGGARYGTGVRDK